MSLLLDTHSLLWYVLEDENLGSVARDAIDSEPSEVFVSPASLWEIAIKIGLGKYRLDEPFEPFWSRTIADSGMSMLPIQISHLARVIELPPFHRDPFDLVAQSLIENLSLVSNDSRLDAYKISRIW